MDEVPRTIIRLVRTVDGKRVECKVDTSKLTDAQYERALAIGIREMLHHKKLNLEDIKE